MFFYNPYIIRGSPNVHVYYVIHAGGLVKYNTPTISPPQKKNNKKTNKQTSKQKQIKTKPIRGLLLSMIIKVLSVHNHHGDQDMNLVSISSS